MDYEKEFEEISEPTRTEITSFVEKQEKEWGWIFLVFLVGSVIVAFLSSFLKGGLALTSLLYSFVGAFFISISVIRRKKEVVVLSMARVGYSKPLAHDLVRSSYLNAIGLILIMLSAIMQAIVLFVK